MSFTKDEEGRKKTWNHKIEREMYVILFTKWIKPLSATLKSSSIYPYTRMKQWE